MSGHHGTLQCFKLEGEERGRDFLVAMIMVYEIFFSFNMVS